MMGVWSSGGNLNTGKTALAGCGSQSAGLSFGGYTTTYVTTTEEYNGSSWSSGGSLNAARYISKDKKVMIVCKKTPWECNTFWAQGGVVRARDEGDIPHHIKDTMDAGVSINNKEAVERLSRCSMDAIDDIIESGFEFDRNSQGELAYTK